MTPVVLEVILHYFYRSEQLLDRDSSQAVNEAHISLFNDGLLTMKHLDENEDNNVEYEITERGEFFVKEGLCKVPRPIQKKAYVFPEVNR